MLSDQDGEGGKKSLPPEHRDGIGWNSSNQLGCSIWDGILISALQQETAQGQARADYMIPQSRLSVQHNMSSVLLEGFFGLNEITLHSSWFLPQGSNSISPAHLSPGRRLNSRDESKCSQSGQAICQSRKKEGREQKRYLQSEVTCLNAAAEHQAAGSLQGSMGQEKHTEMGTFLLPWRMGTSTQHFLSISYTQGKGQTQLEELKTQYKASPAWIWQLRLAMA